MLEGTNADCGIRACPTEIDAVFAALAHPHRRFLLALLGEPGTEETLTAIAAAIATETEESASAPGPGTGIDTIEASLHHVHVPKLDEVDLVAYDRDEQTVTLTDRWEHVQPILEAAESL